MKTNELDHTTQLNNVYDIINHDGTRVRRLKKGVKSIHIDNKTYFVPRANGCFGTISTLYVVGDNDLVSFDITTSDETMIVNDRNSKGLNVSCGFHEEGTSLSYILEENVVLSIFRSGESVPFYQSYIKADEDYGFAPSLDLPIGRYIFIISGATSENESFRYEEEYSVYRYTVVSSRSAYEGIKKAAIITDGSIVNTLQPVKFEIEHRSVLSKDEALNGLCIDEDMNVVGFKKIYLLKDENKKALISFTADYPWLENKRYTLIIGDHLLTISSITFTLSDNRCEVAGIRRYIRDEHNNIYQLFINNDKLLSVVYPAPGVSKIKRQAIELYDNYLRAAAVNMEASKRILPTKHCLVVSSERPTLRPHACHAAVAANLIVNNMTSFEWHNAEELKKDNEWESLDSDKEVSIWCNLSVLCDNRPSVLKHMKDYLMSDKYATLYGTTGEIERFFNTFPELKPFFEKKYMLEENRPSALEIIALFINRVKLSTDYPLSEKAISHICRHMKQLEEQGSVFSRYTDENIKFFTQSHIAKRVQNRYYAASEASATAMWESMQWILPEDIDFDVLDEDCNALNIDDIMRELNEMVGLNMIKDNITDLATQLQFNRRRIELGFNAQPQSSHHMIFTGNPGTGKTTVAKMIGKIFHSLGLLSKGEVMAYDRKDLVGEFIGHTEANMRKIIEEARGNVLFIDEAYALGEDATLGRDFGRHVIESLLPLLAQDNLDMLVILAGYKDEMKALMNTNTGLKGRFPHIWHFENYNADELLEIACKHLEKLEYRLTAEAQTRLYDVIVEELDKSDKHFSNARRVKQMITHNILPRMAKRVMKTPQRTDVDFYATIEAEDIVIIPTKDKKRNPIGFRELP